MKAANTVCLRIMLEELRLSSFVENVYVHNPRVRHPLPWLHDVGTNSEGLDPRGLERHKVSLYITILRLGP